MSPSLSVFVLSLSRRRSAYPAAATVDFFIYCEWRIIVATLLRYTKAWRADIGFRRGLYNTAACRSTTRLSSQLDAAAGDASLTTRMSSFHAVSSDCRRPMSSIINICLLPYLLLFTPGNGERFLTEPEDAVLKRGQDHLLRCTVEDRRGEVQWLRNGFGLGPGVEFEGYPRYRVLVNELLGEHHLMISDVSLEDDALFECQVGATVETTGLASRQAKLTVQLPPDSVVIADGSPIVDVVAGKRHALTCRAVGGKPAPELTWESPPGQPLVVAAADDPDAAVEYVVSVEPDGLREDAASRLTMTPTRDDDGREFVCRARNAAMIESKWTRAQLRVLYEPEVTLTASPSGRLREHDNLQLSCSSSANPDSVSWRWFLDSSELPGEVSSTLLMKSLSFDLHGKQLTCEATNAVGSSRAKFLIVVEYGPRFAAEPQSQPADVGDDVTLTCSVVGNPPPSVYWLRRGADAERVVSRQSTLRVQRVTDEHFATYTCVATSVGFGSVSRDVHILRKGAPAIVSGGQQAGRSGDSAEIECVVRSVPPPDKIVWMKDGRVVEFALTPRYFVREETVPYGTRSVLQIAAVQDSDFAVYNCSAFNAYGSSHQAITFSKKEVLPLPYLLAAVTGGVVLIIIVVVVIVIVCRRHKTQFSSESNSRTSEDSIDMKKSNQIGPDIKVEYSTNTVDDWQQDLLVAQRYPSPRPQQTDYDELRYPLKTTPDPIPRYDTMDYGTPRQYGYARSPIPYANPLTNGVVYGTYPRGIGYAAHSPRDMGPYGPIYGSETYATATRQRPDYWPPPVLRSPKSVSPTGSRLSTNV